MTLHDDERIKDRLTSVADPVGFLSKLFAYSPVAFAVWSADGRVLLTNQAFMDIFLVEPPPEYSVLHDELLAASGMLSFFRRAFAGETVQVPTFWYDPRELTSISVTTGRRVAISMTLFPLWTAGGEIEYVAATYKDQTEIMLTAERLRHSEEQRRLAHQVANVGTFEWNIQTGVNTWSPELETLYGLAPGAFGGRQRDWEDLIHPEDRARAIARVDQAMATLAPVEGEWRVIWPDGSLHWIVGRFQAFCDERGQPLRLIGVNIEITERKRAEAALVASERRFRGFEDSGVIGIVLSDTAGNIKEVNDAFLSMVGYTRDDLRAGRVSGQTLNTPERDRTDAHARRELQATGVARAWEKELLRKDGSRVPILCGVVMLDEQLQESVSFALDLTELKRAEAIVRRSEAQRTAVMEAALDAIVLMDHRGNITDFNPAAEQTFGYRRDEVLGRSLADVLIPERLRAVHNAALERIIAGGGGHLLGKRIELPALRRDGSEFPAEVAVVRIRTEGPPVFTGYIRDITERRQAAEAEMLRRAKEAAEEANSELEAFSYSVAHDLRAPLRSVNGFSGFLLAGNHDLGEKGREYLGRIVAAATRMSHIIDALLSLAQLTRAEVRRRTVDLTQLANAAVEQLRAADPGRDVEVVIAEGLEVEADPQLVRAVFDNLLGNAWKFTSKREGGRIELGREGDGAVPVFFVRDNGAGFDMRYANKLFAPFRRLHSRDEFEGSGIGLATVQRIVRRHGGRIWAEAAENQGAVFRFTFASDSDDGGRTWGHVG